MSIAEGADDAGFEKPSAIGQAYVAASQSLRRFISRWGASGADVEDIAQDALVCAMKAEADHPIENPKAYLFRVAQNLTIRHRVRQARDIVRDIEDVDWEDIPSARPSIEEQVISRQRLAIFCEALATLPPMCRRVFILRKVHGHSHTEIAQRLGISTSTVEKHLAKGFARCEEFIRARENGHATPPSADAARVASQRGVPARIVAARR